MNLVIEGMAEGFVITDGFGDSSAEPPPTVPSIIQEVVLGHKAGGDFGATHPNPALETEEE
jgi:hypothetical protein